LAGDFLEVFLVGRDDSSRRGFPEAAGGTGGCDKQGRFVARSACGAAQQILLREIRFQSGVFLFNSAPSAFAFDARSFIQHFPNRG
jgi:hypothetical protein